MLYFQAWKCDSSCQFAATESKWAVYLREISNRSIASSTGWSWAPLFCGLSHFQSKVRNPLTKLKIQHLDSPILCIPQRQIRWVCGPVSVHSPQNNPVAYWNISYHNVTSFNSSIQRLLPLLSLQPISLFDFFCGHGCLLLQLRHRLPRGGRRASNYMFWLIDSTASSTHHEKAGLVWFSGPCICPMRRLCAFDHIEVPNGHQGFANLWWDLSADHIKIYQPIFLLLGWKVSRAFKFPGLPETIPENAGMLTVKK